MNLKKYLIEKSKTHLIFDFDETLIYLQLPWYRWEERIKKELISMDKSIYQEYKKRKITLSELMNKYVEKFGVKSRDLFIKNAKSFENANLEGILLYKDGRGFQR
ncbi:hypothetical protein HYS91_02000 [Candidatus Daviesbacteria bacterium]|nr:hypothetical protein [Candidatus Daviesbacteria bacterium]